MKLKITQSILMLIISLTGIYFGICAFFNFRKAITQNYLVASQARYDFMGFYIQGIFYCIGFLATVALGILLLFFIKRWNVKKSVVTKD